MKKVIVYSTPSCVYCRMLKDWLTDNKIFFTDYDLSSDHQKADEMIKKTGQMGVPIIEVDEEIIIGFDRKRLEELLEI